jgi:hypothetical protein
VLGEGFKMTEFQIGLIVLVAGLIIGAVMALIAIKNRR